MKNFKKIFKDVVFNRDGKIFNIDVRNVKSLNDRIKVLDTLKEYYEVKDILEPPMTEENNIKVLLEKYNYNFIPCLICNNKPETLIQNINNVDDYDVILKCKCGLKFTYTNTDIIRVIKHWNNLMKGKN